MLEKIKTTVCALMLALLVLPALSAVAGSSRYGSGEGSVQAVRGGCAEKERILERKLQYARQYGNQGQIRGLERSLANVRQWCSDDSLLSKAELNVLDKIDKVAEREQELSEARASGKTDKIAKRERKLLEAREELLKAERERDALLAGG